VQEAVQKDICKIGSVVPGSQQCNEYDSQDGSCACPRLTQAAPRAMGSAIVCKGEEGLPGGHGNKLSVNVLSICSWHGTVETTQGLQMCKSASCTLPLE
jgi:hypothetical protein